MKNHRKKRWYLKAKLFKRLPEGRREAWCRAFHLSCQRERPWGQLDLYLCPPEHKTIYFCFF
jgi:hypothetical protein